jgi:hypothetical protein
LNGKTGEDIKISYAFEYAQQDNKTVDADMKYMLAELGVSVVGLTGKLGYEVMGSDAGKESFSTPLATVHNLQVGRMCLLHPLCSARLTEVMG